MYWTMSWFCVLFYNVITEQHNPHRCNILVLLTRGTSPGHFYYPRNWFGGGSGGGSKQLSIGFNADCELTESWLKADPKK